MGSYPSLPPGRPENWGPALLTIFQPPPLRCESSRCSGARAAAGTAAAAGGPSSSPWKPPAAPKDGEAGGSRGLTWVLGGISLQLIWAHGVYKPTWNWSVHLVFICVYPKSRGFLKTFPSSISGIRMDHGAEGWGFLESRNHATNQATNQHLFSWDVMDGWS